MELLKQNHIPFRAKIKINGREIDFLIGRDAIEIDSHRQDVQKNLMLIREGYAPLHLSNKEVLSPTISDWLKQKYARH
jgi:hypothetical protein